MHRLKFVTRTYAANIFWHTPCTHIRAINSTNFAYTIIEYGCVDCTNMCSQEYVRMLKKHLHICALYLYSHVCMHMFFKCMNSFAQICVVTMIHMHLNIRSNKEILCT